MLPDQEAKNEKRFQTFCKGLCLVLFLVSRKARNGAKTQSFLYKNTNNWKIEPFELIEPIEPFFNAKIGKCLPLVLFLVSRKARNLAKTQIFFYKMPIIGKC